MTDQLPALTFDHARRAVAAGSTPEEAARTLVATLTAVEKLWCLDGDAPTWAGLKYLGTGGYHKAPFVAGQVERVGLPGIRFSDGPRGAVVGNATAFPVSMARGATWDPQLEERIGEAVGQELRAIGANLTGAVCVNLLRHPAWGRAQESYGEDPHHVGELGAALTRGLQRHVMACVKHFACNSMENARFSVDIEVDEVALHEVYLPHFKRIVDEGVASVMSAYNSVNGAWAGQNRSLLTEVLRHEWGFKGFVISDWIFGLRDAAASLGAGLDIEMPYRMIRAQHLAGALQRGEASWADVDGAVARLVATLLRFDDVLAAPTSADVLGSAEHRHLAREVAARSVVLLRNESVDGFPVLPFAPTARVAVFGQLGDCINLGDGGSSDVWDLECHTVLAGLRAAVHDVAYDEGDDLVRAASVAATADVAVVVVGYTYRDEGEYIGETDASLGALFPPADEPDVVERFATWTAAQPLTETPPRLEERPRGFSVGGDRQSLRLHPSDVELIRAVAGANPRTVVAIQAGSCVVATEWIEAVPAVVQAWYGGAEAGPGLADVLLGAVNPSARLPFSVPADEADLPAFERDATSFRYDRWHGWWYLARNGTVPAFPFGFGLSYTTFSLASLDVSVGDGFINASVTVRNTGDRDGADVVQIYADLPDPQAPSRLIGFARVEVPAGAAATAEMAVPIDRLALRDPDRHSWRAVSGRHRLSAARSATDPDAISAVVEL
ncbi:MAG TPA: glycoside hydrolase family 3 N-terminal domain-containing protein [Acidimicrobiales bacterium]|jgi:beta-glucosidase|nr:glycoside hydrolase family 3 N-terminal domain-containing protein [Acidimicrobiales bacterium]